jgi:hypothetical protein
LPEVAQPPSSARTAKAGKQDRIGRKKARKDVVFMVEISGSACSAGR